MEGSPYASSTVVSSEAPCAMSYRWGGEGAGGAGGGERRLVEDVWRGTRRVVRGGFAALVPAHQVVLIVLRQVS